MRTILVGSIKGGSGKTLVSVMLAKYISRQGESVGLLDADLDSPNLGNILGVTTDSLEGTYITERHRFKPVVIDKIQLVSMAQYIDADKGIRIGSGDRTQVIHDMAEMTEWEPKLDTLIIDLPAGSGEIYNAVARKFRNTLVGAVIVAQPNNEYDCLRMIDLCIDGEIPIIGVIENMRGVLCPHCGKTFEVFETMEGIENICKRKGVRYFGKIPLMPNMLDKVRVFELPDDVIKILGGIYETIGTMQVGVKFTKRVKEKVVEGARALLSELIGEMLRYAKTENLVSKLRDKYGFRDESVVLINVVSESREKSYLMEKFVLRKDGIKVLRKDIPPDIYVEMTMRSLAKMIWTDSKPIDEWAKGRVKLRGRGSTQKGIKFLNEFMGEALSGIRNTRTAKILKKLA